MSHSSHETAGSMGIGMALGSTLHHLHGTTDTRGDLRERRRLATMASLLYVPLKRVSNCAAAIASSGPMRPAWRRGAVLLTKGGAGASTFSENQFTCATVRDSFDARVCLRSGLASQRSCAERGTEAGVAQHRAAFGGAGVRSGNELASARVYACDCCGP